ncbi:thioredoxin family protein [Persephonella sp. KM09-Lau-8]|uniref:thioredoxin family protein n=1 Tax=Persephonella sp. KM09-Lau-8 TaxID=1158345 RepID=UPI0006892227|nr:thioredoxin family protein [Persephonella sp. KM09-Lau-8]
MLSDEVKNNLKKEFEKLIEPVQLILRKNDKPVSDEIEELLREISDLSEKIHLTISDRLNCHGYPCISIQQKDIDFGIRFMGKPDGGEFPSFIKTILMVSRNEYDLTERTVEFLEEIDQPVDIKIFITKSCGWCPPTMLKMFSFAMVNKNITTTAIDCYEFSDMAIKYNVAAVPKVVINDKAEFVGLKEENEILGHIFGAIS